MILEKEKILKIFVLILFFAQRHSENGPDGPAERGG